MKTLKIQKLPNENQALQSILAHNKEDFNKDEIYVKINNTTVYKSIATNEIEKGFIGISAILRNHLLLTIPGITTISSHKPQENLLTDISIKISTYGKYKNVISLHEDELKEKRVVQGRLQL
jgi:hypothetical protein